MKQEDEPGNSDGGQEGVMSDTAPKESVNKGSGDPNDAPKVETAGGEGEYVSGSTNKNDGEDHAAEATRLDNTSPEPSSCANTSASSLDGVNSSSPCSEMETGGVRMENGRPEYEMERSISSYDESVAESNPRESLSPCLGCSTQSAVTGKSGRNCETSDKDHSHSPATAVPNCDGRQAETADESMSESNPRNSLSSTSLSSSPGVSDRSGRNSGNSDMDQSLLKPASGTAPILDECQADVATVEQVNCQLSEQDTALQNARSASTSKSKMTLRSGRVTQVESDAPKKHRDISKMKRQKSVGRPTKRTFSVDDQSHSSSEENPEKVLRLESSDPLTTLQETEDCTKSMNAQSRDITNVLSALPMANTTSTNLEDSRSENERLLLANADDAPVHEASYTTSNEEKKAAMRNENSEREKFATVSSEAAHNNELNPPDIEMLDQETTEETAYTESSANQPANNATETGPLPHTAIGGDQDGRFCLKSTDPEMRASDLLPTSDSDVSVEDVKDIQPSGPENRMSCDSASSSDEKEFAASNSTETTTDKFVQDTCGSIQECSKQSVNNPPQQSFVEIPTVEISSGSKPISPDFQKTACSSATISGFNVHSFFPSTGGRDQEKRFERNVALDTEVDVRRERMLEISHAVHRCRQQEPAAAPDSSTEGTAADITSNTATKLQQQISTSISLSSETDATTDDPISCASLDHDGLSESTKKIIYDTPYENKNTASSNTQGAEDKAAEKVPQDTGDRESSEENDTSFALSPGGQFEQRNLQIYRYITTSGGPDVRFSPYVTRRRPLRSGYSGGDNYSRVFFRRRHREARQTEGDGFQNTSGASGSFGDTCSIS